MPIPLGRVAELADAQDSGSCVREDVGVQLPPRPRLLTWAPFSLGRVLLEGHRGDGVVTPDQATPPDLRTSRERARSA
jgi:hypothetical protein